MKLQDLQYDLPPDQIAQHPADARDASRLLVLDRHTGACRHETFARLPQLLPQGALLVLNDTRVLPARLRLRRLSGGRIEGLFLRESEPGTWEIMLTESRRLRPGECLSVGKTGQQLKLLGRQAAGIWRAQPLPGGDAHELLARYGAPPLPPYIKREEAPGPAKADRAPQQDKEAAGVPGLRIRNDASDGSRYQTIYARRPGAVAAPTAGLHFTPEVFANLAAAGIETAYVTLHVGVGTFTPIRTENLADHVMHAEWYECSDATANTVNSAREQGRPMVAVGTTSVRVLESCTDDAGRLRPGSGWTRLFIYPPYRFKIVDGMVTNFHLPGSTLLAMIFAFAGRDATLTAYREAVEHEYRFYSYGDAMLVI